MSLFKYEHFSCLFFLSLTKTLLFFVKKIVKTNFNKKYLQEKGGYKLIKTFKNDFISLKT